MRVLEAKLLNGTPQQYQALDEAIRTAQFVRNKCLRHWMDNQGVNRATLYSLCKDLAREFPFAQKLNSQARQASAERAWSAISNFYRRCKEKAARKGYPKFQKHCRSVEYKQSGWKLSPDGMPITFTDGNQAGTFALYCNGEARRDILSSKVNRVRVIRRADGYYAQFCLDVERREQAEYTGQVVGLDMGLTHFYTDSHGHKVECPKFLRRAERRLKREQRRLSRKLRTPSRLRERRGAKPQSKNYHKQRQRLGKVHLKIQRQRRDWAIKQARCVVASHDVVAYEDLQVRNLVRNRHLAKSIHDASWSLFTGWLDYYGKVLNKVVVAVPPQYTSQDCSQCGHRVKKTLSTRTHRCPRCGVVFALASRSEIDRDENAAINILRKGLELLGEEWNNGTFGQKGTAPKGGTPGETSAAAVEGQPNTVSAAAEPGTRIPCL